MKKRKSGRPLKGRKKRIRTSFTLPPDQLKWLAGKARELKLAKSEVLESIIRNTQMLGGENSIAVGYRFPVSADDLKRFCREHRIKRLSLFGSILGAEFNSTSDIDLLVEFEPKAKPGLFTLVAIKKELSNMLGGREVDLRTPEELSDYFRQEVLDEAEVIYAA